MRWGSVKYWALTGSVVLHAAILAVFTGVHLSRGAQAAKPHHSAAAIRAIDQVTEQPKPVPKVEPIERPEPEPVPEPPLVAEVKPAPEPVVEPVETADVTAGPMVVREVTRDVEFFGQKTAAKRVCYVVDCSGSMYGRMYRVKDQLRHSILKLTGDHAFSLVFFMDGRQLLMSGSGRLDPATAGAKSKALNLIASVRPKGTTDALHALEVAMRLETADGRGAEAFYFLTDGFDLDAAGSQDFLKAAQQLRRRLAPQAAVHTIAYSPQPQDRQLLQTLAAGTGGGFVEVEN